MAATLQSIYLDYAATTPVRPEVFDAMRPFFMERFGNPSSLHAFGQGARKGMELARKGVAAVLGAEANEIIFTAGGSEADNLALFGVGRANAERGKHIVVSTIEHSAIGTSAKALSAQGFTIDYAPVTPGGIVDTTQLARLLRNDTILVSVMLANNETGAVQPMRELSGILRPRGVLLHTDAVQAMGKIEVDVNDLGLDLLSLSAHKIYGPKGVGALYVRKGTRIEPIIHGGHHEHGLRGGTESVPLVVGLAKALELACAERETEMPRLAGLRDALEKGILSAVGGAVVNASGVPRLPQISNISFERVNGETLLLNLDAKGIAVSTGAACSSGTEDPSHVLTAMGMPRNLALGGVRFSLGKMTTKEDIARTIEAVVICVDKLRTK